MRKELQRTLLLKPPFLLIFKCITCLFLCNFPIPVRTFGFLTEIMEPGVKINRALIYSRTLKHMFPLCGYN